MKKDHTFLFCLLIVLFAWAIVVPITALTQNIPFQVLLSRLATKSYQPHYNLFPNNVYFYIYLTMFIAIITIYILKISVWRKRQTLSLPLLLSGVLAGTLLITMALQTIGQTYYFIHEFQWIDGKKIADRYPRGLKEIVDFAGFCKQKLPGKHSCQLITDLDMSRDPGMFFHRTLAYHLYPINIRGIHSIPSDCIIVFVAANALSRIPKGYSVIGKWRSENLLAIKGLPHP